jgi:hypothetical protein
VQREQQHHRCLLGSISFATPIAIAVTRRKKARLHVSKGQ